MSECNCRECIEAGALEMIHQDGWRMRAATPAVTVPHSDGSVCMADVWEQSARLLQESAEAMVAEYTRDGQREEKLEARLTAAERVVEAARRYTAGGEWAGMGHKALDEAMRAYDAAALNFSDRKEDK